MPFIRKFVCSILLYLISARPQINLDLTDSAGNVTWQHDCLHVAATIKYAEDPLQIIPYCISEWPLKWNIQENNFDQKLTFAELSNLHITSQQLYLWSAPMDIIEHYQFYLNQLSTSKDLLSISSQVFYNCTSPRFGPTCQYSLDGYESYDLSLNNVIQDFYSHMYIPTTMTCYMHLQCDRGSTTACLDWTEICNGRIECLHDGVDEEHCWQLEINECDSNEYRCWSGECIPKTFFDDASSVAFDCVDKSDEKLIGRSSLPIKTTVEPTFTQEDVRCNKNDWLQLPFTTSCIDRRNYLLIDSMFLDKPKLVPEDCWFAFRCSFEIPDVSHPKCRDICSDRILCKEIINNTCPDILYIPEVPIMFSHVYLAYTKQAAIDRLNWKLPPTYICYNDQLCKGFRINRTLLSFNNSMCHKPEDFPLRFSQLGRGSWIYTYIKPINQQLYKCNTVIHKLVTVCNSPTMYQCVNSSKCIPHFRVGDGLKDCDYEDDEQQAVINDVCLKDRLKIFFRCTMTNKCIHLRKVENGVCECGLNEYGLCDDEDPILHYIAKQPVHVTVHLRC